MNPSNASDLPYTDTKPQGSADFYYAINATFRFLLNRVGRDGWIRYLEEMGRGYFAPVNRQWSHGGLSAVARNWCAFFSAEPYSPLRAAEICRAVAQPLLMAALAIMISPVVARAHSWQMLAPLPAPNGGFISGEVDGKIVVLGGTNWEGGKKNWLNTAYQFDPATSAWSALEPLTTPLAYGIGANVNGIFVVVGGTTGLEPWRGIVRVRDGRLTSSVEGGLSLPAVLSAGGAIKGEIIVAGGTDDAANVKALSRTVAVLDLKTGRTRVLPEFPGLGFGTAACVGVGDELFLFAGANWDVSANAVKNTAEAWAFSAARGAWRHLKPYPISARGVTAVALDEHRIYLAGGFVAGDFTDHAFIYNIVTDSFTPATVLPYQGQVGLVRCGEYIYCIGGEDRMKHRSDAVHRIKIAELAP
jgi:hypothetical protein